MDNLTKPQSFEDPAPHIPFQPFKKGETSRSLQTLLRNENRAFIRLISMVDNKANIMIHLNSLLLSGLAIFAKFFSPFTLFEKIALLILLVCCIISLVLAALAARPVRTLTIHTSDKSEEYLFGNALVQLPSKNEFLENFDKVIRDQGLIYKNMALEFYTLSKILAFKNKRLRGSYNVLLIGILITGVLIIFYNLLVLY
ncbi:Pycsar system effector family protein [Catalinimonas sp. 4WD22]|uniref:Pycsar system effector family protein n=1 Tax=Catalinimonas locisalis TaxID=3133978 RepID=UPI003101B2E3